MPHVKILGFELNPGPYTIKEHVFITVLASVGGMNAYSTNVIATQRVFYQQNYSFICKSPFAETSACSRPSSMDVHHVNAINRTCGLRSYLPFPCYASFHECVQLLRLALNFITVQYGQPSSSCALSLTPYIHKAILVSVNSTGWAEKDTFFSLSSVLPHGVRTAPISSFLDLIFPDFVPGYLFQALR